MANAENKNVDDWRRAEIYHSALATVKALLSAMICMEEQGEPHDDILYVLYAAADYAENICNADPNGKAEYDVKGE